MKSVLNLCRFTFLAGLIVSFANECILAQESNVVELTVHARRVPKHHDAIRLLPREHELRDGNAAIELLRMPWEQSHFMELTRKRMDDWLEMKGDNPELLKYESSFAVFKDKMRRAAYTRDADWDYPIGEQPLVTIWLPDVQGMRQFAGRVMLLWIRVQISNGELKNAEEGIRIQMACARHVCRTPFIVCHLVGAAIANISFDEMEDLIQQPDAENYYYALSMLPESLGDYDSAVDLDATLLPSSMPSIAGKSLPPVGDPVWKTAFAELFENYLSPVGNITEIDRAILQQQAKVFENELAEGNRFSNEEIGKMSEEETFIRWLLENHESVSGRYIAALQLPAHESIQSFVSLAKEISELEKKILFRHPGPPSGGSSPVRFFDMYTPQAFLGCHRIGSTAKLLQIVEAIRHYASLNDNKLPESLEDIKLPIPRDPFTDKSVIYKVENGVATLQWPEIPNISEKFNRARQSYKIKMAE